MESGSNIFIEIIGICLVVLIVLIFTIRFVTRVYMPFAEERDYIRMEIARSHGSSRIRWQNELHRLYLAQIPLIGGRLAESHKKREKKKMKRRRK